VRTPKNDINREADRLLDRVETRYGRSSQMRQRLFPIVKRILGSGAPPAERKGMLRLAVEAYSGHMHVQNKIGELRDSLRNRLNDVYGELLGIEPPRLD